MNKYKFIPVNNAILVEPIKEDEFLKRAGINTDDEKKVGSLFMPGDVSNKDKHGMVNYAKGEVVKINTTESDIPFEVKVGDTIVYNVEAVLLNDHFGEPSLSMVKYNDILALLREE